MRQGAKIALAITAVLAGCTSFPSIPEDRVNISTLVKKIECEIYQSSHKHPQLTEHDWLAVADLTLQVDDEAGIKPSLSYLQPTHFLFGLSGSHDRTQQNIFVLGLTIHIKELDGTACEKPVRMAFLDGDLGLEDVIAKSFSAVSADNKAAKFDPEHTGFSTSLKFVITNSVSAGPNWTLTRFTGPGAELFGFSRTDTHQLLISFTPKGASKEVAIGQAQGRNLFMLLQSLRTLPFDRIR